MVVSNTSSMSYLNLTEGWVTYVCVLTQRPPEVSAMLKAMISDATVGLVWEWEGSAMSEKRLKSGGIPANRGDIFQKKKARPPRAGCESESED